MCSARQKSILTARRAISDGFSPRDALTDEPCHGIKRKPQPAHTRQPVVRRLDGFDAALNGCRDVDVAVRYGRVVADSAQA